MNTVFTLVLLAHAPDADPVKHKCMVETPTYTRFAAVVRDQVQAVEECKELAKEKGIHLLG